MAKKLMVNMGCFVDSSTASPPDISDKEAALLKAVASNPMADIVYARQATGMTVMQTAGVVVSLIRKGLVASYKDRFGVQLAAVGTAPEVLLFRS